jgi:hypothetical protein
VPVEQFANALLARAAFDLARNPAFAELLRARVQRQLARLRLPDWVRSLEAVAVEPGAAAPSVANLAALPAPDAGALAPALVCDFRYAGAFTVTVEARVDVRDAPAWGALDRALDRVEGRGGGGGGSGGLAASADGAASASAGSLGGASAELEAEDDGEELAEGDGSEAAASANSPSGGGGALVGALRGGAARSLRRLAAATADRVAAAPLRVRVTVALLEGAVVLWAPPPPGDRLFYAFLSPPSLTLRAAPQLADRALRVAAHASRVSRWIAGRLEAAFSNQLVFPSGGELLVPGMMALWHASFAAPLPDGRLPRGAPAPVEAAVAEAGAAAAVDAAAAAVEPAVAPAAEDAAAAPEPAPEPAAGGGEGAFLSVCLRAPAAAP